MTPSSSELFVIADCSGSMSEMGKQSLLQNLLLYIQQHLVLHQNPVAVTMLALTEQLTPLSIDEAAQVKLVQSSKTSLSALEHYLEAKCNDEPTVKLLLLSDGYFESKQIQQFSDWHKKHAKLYLATVAVGGDANEFQLAKLASPGLAFFAQDICLSLQVLCAVTVDNPITPLAIKDLCIE